ncbi:hypothetical protein KM043_000971 [Ampulex compressa]|nr:hypothetical protein KM043_000971 [Ampulex compressa]
MNRSRDGFPRGCETGADRNEADNPQAPQKWRVRDKSTGVGAGGSASAGRAVRFGSEAMPECAGSTSDILIWPARFAPSNIRYTRRSETPARFSPFTLGIDSADADRGVREQAQHRPRSSPRSRHRAQPFGGSGSRRGLSAIPAPSSLDEGAARAQIGDERVLPDPFLEGEEDALRPASEERDGVGPRRRWLSLVTLACPERKGRKDERSRRAGLPGQRWPRVIQQRWIRGMCVGMRKSTEKRRGAKPWGRAARKGAEEKKTEVLAN